MGLVCVRDQGSTQEPKPLVPGCPRLQLEPGAQARLTGGPELCPTANMAIKGRAVDLVIKTLRVYQKSVL